MRLPSPLGRRALVKTVLITTGGTALTALLAACGTSSSPATPSPTVPTIPPGTASTASPTTPAAPAAPSSPKMTTGAMSATSATPSVLPGKRLGELKVGMPGTYGTFDPQETQSNYGDRVYSMLYDTLIRRDFTNGDKLVPSLATEWKRVDDTTLDLTLRKGVTWHDGAPFSAADVKYTFDRVLMQTPKLEASGPAYFPFARVEVLDDSRVRIVTTQPDPVLEKRLASGGAQIIPAAYHQRVGTDVFRMKPVGTGPFKLVEFTPDDHLTLEAHDAHFDGPPGAMKLSLRIIPETAARIAAITNGEIDLATNVPPDQIPTLAANKNLSVKAVPLANIHMFRMNGLVKPTDKREIRQAIGYAIDRKTLTETVWGGNAVWTRGWQYAGEEYYNPNRPLAPYDPDRAKQLLSQGGYAGEPIVYLYDAPNYYTNEREVAEALMGMFKAVGINAKLDTAESAQILNAFKQNTRNLMATSSSSNNGDPDGYLYRSWGPDSSLQKNGWWSAQSAARYNELGQQARTTLDKGKRFDLYQGMLDEFEREAPLGILYTPKEAYAMKTTIDWTPYPLYFMDLRPYNFRVR